jgi:hypothetical protein
MHYCTLCCGVFALILNESHAQQGGPKALKVDGGADGKLAVGMVNDLRRQLGTDEPTKLLDALSAWRNMTEFLRSSGRDTGQITSLLRHRDPAVRREAGSNQRCQDPFNKGPDTLNNLPS